MGVIAPRDSMYVLRYSCSTSIALWEGVEILATFKVSYLLSIAKQDEISQNFCWLKHRFILAKFNAVKHNRLTSISSYRKEVSDFEWNSYGYINKPLTGGFDRAKAMEGSARSTQADSVDVNTIKDYLDHLTSFNIISL